MHVQLCMHAREFRGSWKALTYVWISEGVRGEDASQRTDAELALIGGVLWQRPVKVALDLIGREVLLAERLLHQRPVIAGMHGHLSRQQF